MAKYNLEDDKIYLTPGDLVILKLDLPNKPIMMVHKIERYLIRDNSLSNSPLKGVRVRWFTSNGLLQEAVFSTKDLILVEN